MSLLQLTPINIIKGKKEALKNFLQKMCDTGYFTNSYEEIYRHFAFNYTLLSDNSPINFIDFKTKSKSEIFRFCYFLRNSELVNQPLFEIWQNFSFNNKQLQANSYSLAAYSNNHFPEPYRLVSETKLSYLLKKFYDDMK